MERLAVMNNVFIMIYYYNEFIIIDFYYWIFLYFLSNIGRILV